MKMKILEKKLPRKVDFANNADDYGAAVMGMMGFSTRAILSRYPGFSQHQVTYRLNKKSIRRADYRNGETELSRAMVDSALMGVDDDGIIRRVRLALQREAKKLTT